MSSSFKAPSICTLRRNNYIRLQEVSVTLLLRFSTSKGTGKQWIYGQRGKRRFTFLLGYKRTIPRPLYTFMATQPADSSILRVCSVIAYVLLCGYSPFRGEDTQEMIRETTEAKIEFHEQYWSKISNEGALFTRTTSVDIRLNHNSAKTFIKALLNPDPSQRPTAQQALNSHVSGVHYPSSALTSLTIPIVVDDSQSLYRT